MFSVYTKWRPQVCLHLFQGSWGSSSSLTAGSIESSSSGVLVKCQSCGKEPSLLPGLEMSPEDQDSVVVKESVLMLNIPQQVPSPSKGLLQAGLGAHLVLQLAELWD